MFIKHHNLETHWSEYVLPKKIFNSAAPFLYFNDKISLTVSKPMPKKLSTKKRILITAIRMFNEQGVQNVTSRHIAAEIGIAYGNLDYHYRNKEALLLAIYEKMRSEISEHYILYKEYPSPFEHLHHFLGFLEKFQYRYRFFNLDLLEITRSYPSINKIIIDTLQLRKLQMSHLFEEIVKADYLFPQDGNGYERLQHKIRIIITFWLPQQILLTSYTIAQTGEMSQHIWELIVPYMTERGLKEYQRLIKVAI